jgi:methylamine dehydrogenase accessory protein MauD
MLNTLGIASNFLLWLVALFLGFLLLGTLRALGLLRWRLEQLEATTPTRLGRSGLKPGKKAPDFTLRSLAGPEVSLHDFAGRKVFLVFTQAGCGPCQQIMPELNRLAGRDLQVLVANRGDAEAARHLVPDGQPPFPVLIQDGLDLSRKYEAFATPFAFLIDDQGTIASKGIITCKQHIGYVLSAADGGGKNTHVEKAQAGTERGESEASVSYSNPSKEVDHV